MTTTPAPANPHGAVREDWLASLTEAAIDPARPIVDAHHHLWNRAHYPYLFDGFLRDLDCGHNIRQTVYVESLAMHRADGPVHLRSVGETEFANGVAAMSASGGYGTPRVCAGIVTYVNLCEPEAASALDAHVMAGNGRLKGVRQISAWHADDAIKGTSMSPPRGLLSDAGFRRGFSELAKRDLAFDAWLYHTQLNDFHDLAKAFPDTRLVLDHVGGPLGIGPYAGQRPAVTAEWQRSMSALAQLDNVHVKLSGLGMRISGFDLHAKPQPPTSGQLAALWAPYFDFCIETFGPNRCMFASNFPVDKGSCSYGTLWNAHKRVAEQLTPAEQDALFQGTARAVYRLGDD